MVFEDFEEKKGEDLAVPTTQENKEKIGQEQVYDLFTSQEVSWQSIIYDLINSEQLEPWDIDLVLLSQKYLEKIKEMEEANFFISSKVLLACSLLLRIKSEILLNQHIKSLDEILFGKKEEKKYEYERIEIDESEIPELLPRTPMPRFRKVTLQELIGALNKAMTTETRRIEKDIRARRALRDTEIILPKRTVNVRERIRKIYAKIRTWFKKKEERMSFTELAGEKKEERIATFLPLLHLDSQEKVWLEQEAHFEEIWIWLKSIFNKRSPELEELREEIQEQEKEIKEELDNEQLRRIEKLNKDFENPLANFFDMVEKS